MHTEQLEFIIEVDKAGSIALAAQNLHVSQSGLSKSIANLEAELGLRIFRRSRLGTIPTDEGKIILQKAYEIVVKLHELKEEAKLCSSLLNEELKIAAVPSLFMSFFPSCLSAFKKEFPRVNIDVVEKASVDIIEDVRKNKIDIGLIPVEGPYLEKYEDLIIETLIQGKMRVYVGRNSTLSSRKTLAPKDLLGKPIVLYSAENIKVFTNNLFKQHGKMNILFTSNNLELIKRNIAEGLALSFFTDFALRNDPYQLNGDIVSIPLVDNEQVEPIIPFGLVRSKKFFSSTSRQFLDLLKFQMQNFN